MEVVVKMVTYTYLDVPYSVGTEIPVHITDYMYLTLTLTTPPSISPSISFLFFAIFSNLGTILRRFTYRVLMSTRYYHDTYTGRRPDSCPRSRPVFLRHVNRRSPAQSRS